MAWFNNRGTASVESLAAVESASLSVEQALEDLAKADKKLEESKPLIEEIQKHNEANHYDDWLTELLESQKR